jgi:hypothetical protein
MIKETLLVWKLRSGREDCLLRTHTDSRTKMLRRSCSSSRSTRGFRTRYDGKMALVFIAICHSCLGQHAEAIRSYQKGVREYPWQNHSLEIAYFSLGHIHMEQGQKSKLWRPLKAASQPTKKTPIPTGLGSKRHANTPSKSRASRMPSYRCGLCCGY